MDAFYFMYKHVGDNIGMIRTLKRHNLEQFKINGTLHNVGVNCI